MNRPNRSLLAAGCLLALLGGCGPDEPAQPRPIPADSLARPAPPDTAVPAPAPAASKTDTLYIGGAPTVVRLDRFEEPGLFHTFVPEQIQVERAASGEGTAVWFYPSFGGTPNENAYMRVFVPSDDWRPSMEQFRAFVAGSNGLMESNGWRPESGSGGPSDRCPWASSAYPFTAPDQPGHVIGLLCIGAHAGRPFYVMTHYPAEYADGVGPRFARILDEFRWADGEGLSG